MRGGGENVEGKGCGWRVILDKDVFNDAKEHVGTIEDLIVTRDKGISDAIIGVSVFPGVDATMSPTATISAQSQACAASFLVQAKKLSMRRQYSLMPTNGSLLWRQHASPGVRALVKRV